MLICDERFTSHARLGVQAAALLPSWEQQLLLIPPSGEELQLLPRCDSALEQLAFDCLLMDWLYDERFRHLALQENGALIPHMMPDLNGDGAFFSGHPVHPGKCFEIVRYLLGNAVEELKKGRIHCFCRRAGILGHFLQDLTAPTHNIQSKVLRQLFPDPVPERLEGLKYCYETAPDLGGKTPVVMGDTLDRAAFFITNQALKYADDSRRFLPELISASYRRDHAQCCGILRTPARWAVELSADAWHTAFALAFNRFDGTVFPEKIPLTHLYCAAHHPDIYAYTVSGNFLFDGKKYPLTLIDGAQGKNFVSGIAMTGHSGMKYFTGGIFSKVTFTLGLAEHPSSYDKHINLDFSVETDREWCENASLDMEYGTARRISVNMTPGQPCRPIEADISGSAALIFASRATPYMDHGGSVNFAIPHIGIGDVQLWLTGGNGKI